MRSLRGGAAPMNRIIMLSRTFTEIHIVIYAKRIQLECVCKYVCVYECACLCVRAHIFILFSLIRYSIGRTRITPTVLSTVII